MTFDQFQKSPDEPKNLSPSLRALWWDARGDWEQAHTIAQQDQGREAAWVHAYLHRKEGDGSNARYWYARAAKSESRENLEAEWEQIARDLLQQVE